MAGWFTAEVFTMSCRLTKPEIPFVADPADLKEIIYWMLLAGVSRKTLADFLHTSVENISTIGSRGSHSAKQIRPPFFGIDRLNHFLARPLTTEELEPLRKRREALEPGELEYGLEEIFLSNTLSHTYAAGIAKLREFRPKLGRPTRDPRLVKLHARYHYYLSWFYNTLGCNRSAIEEANVACVAAVDAYRYTRARDSLQIIADAAVIASNSYLTRSEPVQARHALRLAKEACAGTLLSQYYWRQLALADLQQGHRDEALKNLDEAKKSVLNCSENPADVVLIHDLFTNFLTSNWDHKKNGALEALQTVASESYPRTSLERSFTLKWVIATGMSTDSHEIHQQAMAILEDHLDDLLNFGHNATFGHLMLIAPAIPPSRLSEFVALALHQNASRNS